MDGRGPLLRAVDRLGFASTFRWWVGLQVSVAFMGPSVVAHLAHQPPERVAFIGFSGLIVSMTSARLDPHRRAAHSLALVALITLLVPVFDHAPAGPVWRIAILAAVGLLAGAGRALGPPAVAYGSLLTIVVILRSRVPHGAEAMLDATLGGLLAVAAGYATRALAGRTTDRRDDVALAFRRLADLFEQLIDPSTDVGELRGMLRHADIGRVPAVTGRQGVALARLAAAASDARSSVAVLALSAARLPPQAWVVLQTRLRDRLAVAAEAGRDAAGQIAAGRLPDLGVLRTAATGPPDELDFVWEQVVDHLAGWNSGSHDPPPGRRADRRLRTAFAGPTQDTRHTARLVVALVICGIVSWAAGTSATFGSHSPWMALGVYISLQLPWDATVTKGLERGAGTTLGGLLIVTVALLPGGLWFGWVLVVSTFLAFSYRESAYGVYVFFLTPVVVIGFGGPTAADSVLGARILFTVAGVALAITARRLFWPGWRWRRAASITSALDAQARMVNALQDAVRDPAAVDVRRAVADVRLSLRELRIETEHIETEPASDAALRTIDDMNGVAQLGIELLALAVTLPMALPASDAMIRDAITADLAAMCGQISALLESPRTDAGVPIGLTGGLRTLTGRVEGLLDGLPAPGGR